MLMPQFVLKICGVILIAGGLVGLILPIIPGIPLILAGSALLGGGFLHHLLSQ